MSEMRVCIRLKSCCVLLLFLDDETESQ
jgi:hypothetical protein